MSITDLATPNIISNSSASLKNPVGKKFRLAREGQRKAGEKCEGCKCWNDQPEKRNAILGQIKGLRRKPKGQKRITFVETADRLNDLAKTDDIYSTISGKPWSGAMVQNFIQRYDKI
ncbi:MAG: hypothetical protein PHP53_24400 [Prolixibacteraceae bacterium]|nr:hypothetical protein [Prolixibacteraceae bacterium]